MVIACLVDDVAHKYGSTCLVSAYGGLRGAICRDCTVLVILIYALIQFKLEPTLGTRHKQIAQLPHVFTKVNTFYT
jgi:hypothetical protein